jgi:hypothetical protein
MDILLLLLNKITVSFLFAAAQPLFQKGLTQGVTCYNVLILYKMN